MPDARSWTEHVHVTYDREAARYDRALDLFALVGFRTEAYRQRTVEALDVRPGQTVLDLGCGTGRTLPLLARAVGEGGRVVGLDLSGSALAIARERVADLPQVELVRADARRADLGTPDRVVATFSLSMMPDPAAVAARATDALAPGGRMAVLDFWTPDAWPRPLRAAAFALARPFGETRAMAERDLRPHLAPHLAFDTERSFYLDAAYLIAGTPV